MPAVPSAATRRLPEGFRVLLIHPPGPSPVQLGVLARSTPDPAAGHFVLLRDLADARAYLGCLTDAAGRLLEWVEIWVQNVDGLEGRLPAARETFNNPALDLRWKTLADTLAGLETAEAVITGHEGRHPAPAFLDLATGTPSDPAGWELCQDDAALTAAAAS